MDILCTDKTGTLTRGSVELDAALGVDGQRSERVLRLAVLNAMHHTGYSNPIDDAILKGHEDLASGTERLAEVPYDFMRKRLSVLVKTGESTLLVMKGAFEEVLSACTFAEENHGQDSPLEKELGRIRSEFERLSGEGYRVFGVAVKAVEPTTLP